MADISLLILGLSCLKHMQSFIILKNDDDDGRSYSQ